MLALEILRRWSLPRSAEAIASIEAIVGGAADQLERIETKAPRSWIVPGAPPRPRQRRSPSTCTGLQLVPPLMLPLPPSGTAAPRIHLVQA